MKRIIEKNLNQREQKVKLKKKTNKQRRQHHYQGRQTKTTDQNGYVFCYESDREDVNAKISRRKV